MEVATFADKYSYPFYMHRILSVWYFDSVQPAIFYTFNYQKYA